MSLINSSSRENSENTIEIARMINNEITSQVTRKLDEIRDDINKQVLEVINSAITEKVLPSIQNVVGIQKSGIKLMRNHRSGRVDRNPGDCFSNVDRRLGTSTGGHF